MYFAIIEVISSLKFALLVVQMAANLRRVLLQAPGVASHKFIQKIELRHPERSEGSMH